MLEYDKCNELKGAGYPQKEQCECFYYDDGMTPGFCLGSFRERGEWFSSAERPNPEELSEEIRQRWPDLGLKVDIGCKEAGDFFEVAGYWKSSGALWGEETGTCLAEALANLYIALAGDQNGL